MFRLGWNQNRYLYDRWRMCPSKIMRIKLFCILCHFTILEKYFQCAFIHPTKVNNPKYKELFWKRWRWRWVVITCYRLEFHSARINMATDARTCTCAMVNTTERAPNTKFKNSVLICFMMFYHHKPGFFFFNSSGEGR